MKYRYARVCPALAALIKFLDEGLAQNALLVFTSDHGDMLGSQGAYLKSEPEEESLHVPLYMRLPEMMAFDLRKCRRHDGPVIGL